MTRPQDFSAYAKRDALLREMGYKSYRAYMASELWATIRQQVLDRDQATCVVCKKPATQVHHKHYSIAALKGEWIKGMVSLCGGCHRMAEIDKHGRKTTNKRANQRLKRKSKNLAKDACWNESPEYRRLWRLAKDLRRYPARRDELKDIRSQMRRMIREKQ